MLFDYFYEILKPFELMLNLTLLWCLLKTNYDFVYLSVDLGIYSLSLSNFLIVYYLLLLDEGSVYILITYLFYNLGRLTSWSNAGRIS